MDHESELRQEILGDWAGDSPFEQLAAFCPASLSRSREDIENVQRVYDQVRPEWELWRNLDGDNEPLRRRIDGERDWDFNVDGMAHYGMLPDFLQDLKNVGLGPDQLRPLFYSAEDYIRMWDRAETASRGAR
jgi:hypothetical protein